MTNNNHTHIHEPLIQVSKRDDMLWYQSWIVRAVAIIFALIICGLVTVMLTGLDPISVYISMFEGNFGTDRRLWAMLKELALLLCVSLAVTPAFKMKFWNIGAEGQTLAGALACSACMILLSGHIPSALLIPVMLVASVVAGLIWAIIPAYFKAKFNTNETLFTLMMNYIAMQLVSFCIVFWENPKNSNTVGVINPDSMLGWLPSVGGQKYAMCVIVVAVLTVLMYVYLRYSKQGYEISVVGESQNTARYVGINVKKVIIRTMSLSGALCGVAGFLIVSGVDHSITTSSAGGMGFTAIMVSWLAKFNPIVMVLTTFLIVFLECGAGQIATAFDLNHSVADILTGIILFFIIGSEFFINYKIKFRTKQKEA